jgi:hypothetical protein
VFGQILVEFLFRLTFGVAAAMAVTSARDVTSGFFRIHLWVLMGLQTLAALALYSLQPATNVPAWLASAPFWLAVTAAVTSYVGAVIWMYERRAAGKLAISVVAGCAFAGCVLPLFAAADKPLAWQLADRATGGLLLGLVTTAMLLGHWYLNTPTMKLAPLRRLIALLAAVVFVRIVLVGAGAWMETSQMTAGGSGLTTWALFLSLRWLAGLVGVLALAWLTWQTLKIPNTQSATGILYAAVVLAFIGELTSQLLSAEARYPI